MGTINDAASVTSIGLHGEHALELKLAKFELIKSKLSCIRKVHVQRVVIEKFKLIK